MTKTPATAPENPTPPRPVLSFDPKEFCQHLADCDWTEEQKVEFIEALWQIVVSFVDLGFDLHPVQQVIDAPSTLELDSGDVLGSSNSQHFETTSEGFNHLVEAGRPDS